MIHVLVRHHVRDFDAWRAAFDGAIELRREVGELSYEMFRDADNPNQVTVHSLFRDEPAAKHFFGFGPVGPSMASKRLLRGMMEAGVDEAPTVFFMNRIDGGDT